MPYGSSLSEGFVRQLADKEVRDEFVADQVRTRIALMIRALRDQPGREWSQTELGERMGKPQSVVSRIEDPDYGKLSLQTLLEVAAAFDLPLLVDIPEWDDWLERMRHVSSEELHRHSFDAERLTFGVREQTATNVTTAIDMQGGLFIHSSLNVGVFGGQVTANTGHVIAGGSATNYGNPVIAWDVTGGASNYTLTGSGIGQGAGHRIEFPPVCLAQVGARAA